MERQGKSLEELYADLIIDEEDEGGLIVEKSEAVLQKQSYVLIGKFLTEKNINFIAMQNVLATLWRPKEGMEVHDIGGMRYSFVFFHKLDIQKVIEGGPWTFEQATLILYQLEDGEDPNTVQLQNVDMWIQVYDIPRGLISENILKSIGMSIGKFVKMDANTLDGVWKPFVRIRVSLNVQKPLKRRLKIKREGEGWSWVNFKYERLGTFCFVCGILGHSERDCSIVYANADKIVERAYGIWLRAPSKNAAKLSSGVRWLKNTGTQLNTVTSMVAQGDNREEARFMEEDGVVRENYGDRGGVVVKGRDLRPSDKPDSNNENIGIDNMERESGVSDPKRKRVEDTVEKNQEDNHENMNNQFQNTGHLNLHLAGPVTQARLGL